MKNSGYTEREGKNIKESSGLLFGGHGGFVDVRGNIIRFDACTMPLLRRGINRSSWLIGRFSITNKTNWLVFLRRSR
jgi:hypothetical protein